MSEHALYGCVLLMSESLLEDNAKAMKLGLLLGVQYAYQPSIRVTHFVTKTKEMSDAEEKMRSALKHHGTEIVQVVTIDWFNECLKRGERVDENEFKVPRSNVKNQKQ